MQAKEGLNNLIFPIGFQMLKIYYFQMALNTSEMRSNGVKTVFFQKITKNRPAAGGEPSQTPIASGNWGLLPQTPVNDTLELQNTSSLNMSPNLEIFVF